MSDFWRTKTLAEMSDAEWESLCDGCGQCCLHKLEDADTGDFYVTDLACHMLDCATARCRDYTNRKAHVPDCVQLTAKAVPQTGWLPETCAYRLVADGKDLPEWHPLKTGNPDSVHAAGISVKHWATNALNIPGEPNVDTMTQRIQYTLAGIKPGKG